MSDQIFWYLSRSSGLVSWLAAAGAILVGTMIPSRLLGRKPTIPWLTDLHRMLAAMASVFLLIHMATLWFDEFVALRFDDLLIPWVAEIPGLSRTSLALGVIAAWLMAAVELTSLVRERLPERLWHSIHLTSYLILALGTVHAVLAGSDVTNPVIASIGTSALTAVILATVVRLRRRRRRPPPEDREVGPVERAPARQPEPVRAPGSLVDWPEPVSSTRDGTRPPATGRPPGPSGRG